MNDLLLEIIIYLLIAGLIGFIVGWLVRGESKKQPCKKNTEVTTNDKAEETKKEEIIPEIMLLTQARAEGKDNLSRIKGVGAVLEKKLNQLGIYHFDQIASWNTEQQAWIGVQLLFPKKVEREKWVKQVNEFLKNSKKGE